MCGPCSNIKYVPIRDNHMKTWRRCHLMRQGGTAEKPTPGTCFRLRPPGREERALLPEHIKTDTHGTLPAPAIPAMLTAGKPQPAPGHVPATPAPHWLQNPASETHLPEASRNERKSNPHLCSGYGQVQHAEKASSCESRRRAWEQHSRGKADHPAGNPVPSTPQLGGTSAPCKLPLRALKKS